MLKDTEYEVMFKSDRYERIPLKTAAMLVINFAMVKIGGYR